MKKIISYSLWGQDTRYTIGAIQNSKLAKYYFPGWISRFYCSLDVPAEIIQEIRNIENTDIVLLDEPANWTGMFWRFYAAADSDIMISRDSDARLSSREACAVQNWLLSNDDFHIIRDHPYHGRPIMGGMWGCRNGILSNIQDLIHGFNKLNRYEIDQDFLSNIVYPMIRDRSVVHDPFYENKPFPKECGKRIPCFHIGQAYDQYGVVLGVDEYGPASYLEYIRANEGIVLV